jgi:hypothetical protein
MWILIGWTFEIANTVIGSDQQYKVSKNGRRLRIIHNGSDIL